MRRRLALGLVPWVLLASSLPVRAEAPDFFTDVGLWASPVAVDWNGRRVTTFYPFRTVTRLPDGTVVAAGDPQPVPGGPFAWAADGITAAVRWGLMHGYEGPPVPEPYTIPWTGRSGVILAHPMPAFDPARAVTRAEFAAVLVRAGGLTPSAGPAGSDAGFPDVSPSDWFAGDLAALAAAGVVRPSDYPTGALDPQGPITRAEMALWLGRAAQEAGIPAREPAPAFRDVPPGDPLFGWVEPAAARGLVGGRTDGTFGPREPVTRAEAAVVADRFVRRDTAGAPRLAELENVVAGALAAVTAVGNDDPLPDMAPFRRYFTDGALEFLAPPPADGAGITDYPGVFGGGAGIDLPNLFFNAAVRLHGTVVGGRNALDGLRAVFLGRSVAQVEAVGHGVSVLSTGDVLPARFDTMLFLRRDGGSWKIADAYPMA
jgi:hypothetical protein